MEFDDCKNAAVNQSTVTLLSHPEAGQLLADLVVEGGHFGLT